MATMRAPRSQRASLSSAASRAMPRSARSSWPARAWAGWPGATCAAAKRTDWAVLVQSTLAKSRLSARSSVANSSQMRAALLEQPVSFSSAA